MNQGMNHGTRCPLPWQTKVYRHLSGSVSQGRLAHALLLSSPQDCGLKELGDSLMKVFLCAELNSEGPCGQCRSCQLQRAGSHPDGFTVVPEEGSSFIKVDAIRQLSHKMALTPSMAPRKAALIHPAEAMNINASNALLKTLEEPQGETVILLLSHAPHQLLPTIRSRCQAQVVGKPATSMAMEWLEAQKSGLPQEDLSAALAAAQGLPFRALEYTQSDLLEKRSKIAADLLLLAQGKGRALTAVKRWSDVPADTLWQWLAQWMAGLQKLQIQAGDHNQYDLDPAIQDLSQAPAKPMTVLLDLQKKALEAWRLSDTTLRQDLLLSQWLLEWQHRECSNS